MLRLPNKLLTTLCASTIAIATAQVAAADIVVLSTNDGRTSVAGELLSFDGTNYTLRTSLGELTLSGNDATCEGTACPALTTETAALIPNAEPASYNANGLMMTLVHTSADH